MELVEPLELLEVLEPELPELKPRPLLGGGLPPLGRLPPELLPEPALELRPPPDPELEGGLLWLELPPELPPEPALLPPLQPELGRDGPEPEGPALGGT